VRHLGLKTIGLTAAVVVLALGAGAAIGGERAKATKQVEAGGTGFPGNTYFDPENLAIHKGDRVHWTFTGDYAHDVYLTHGPRGIDKSKYRFGFRDPGDELTTRFQKKGTYKFICTVHSGTMHLKVDVNR
jgi:plastocyanin